MSGYWKRYGLTLITLLLVVLGAAMPWLTSLGQDAKISKLQENLELNTVSLTLLENGGVEQALRVVLSDYVAVPWGGGTNMTQEQALQASLEILAEMDSFGLLMYNELYLLSKVDGQAEPYLLVAEDGSSVLVWNCIWDTGNKTIGYTVIVDDVSGKAVQMRSGTAENVSVVGPWPEDSYYVLENWLIFLEYYYSMWVTDIIETENAAGQLIVCLSPWEDTESYEMRLTLLYKEVAFNY